MHTILRESLCYVHSIFLRKCEAQVAKDQGIVVSVCLRYCHPHSLVPTYRSCDQTQFFASEHKEAFEGRVGGYMYGLGRGVPVVAVGRCGVVAARAPISPW